MNDNIKRQQESILKNKTFTERKYVGYVESIACNVKNCEQGNEVSFALELSPVEENPAHCNICMIYVTGLPAKVRNDAISQLADCFENSFVQSP